MHFPTGNAYAAIETDEIRVMKNKPRAFFIIKSSIKSYFKKLPSSDGQQPKTPTHHKHGSQV